MHRDKRQHKSNDSIMENNDEHEEWDSGCNTASCYADSAANNLMIDIAEGVIYDSMKIDDDDVSPSMRKDIIAICEATLKPKFIHRDDGSMLRIDDIEYDFTDSEGLHHFYCDTEFGKFHTTNKDIYRSI